MPPPTPGTQNVPAGWLVRVFPFCADDVVVDWPVGDGFDTVVDGCVVVVVGGVADGSAGISGAAVPPGVAGFVAADGVGVPVAGADAGAPGTVGCVPVSRFLTDTSGGLTPL
jgi:hypothetical protein